MPTVRYITLLSSALFLSLSCCCRGDVSMAFPRWLSLHGLAENVFVPEAYSYTRDADADRRVHAPLYTHFSGFNMFGLSFSAVALGIARTCIAEFQKLAAEKSPQAAGWAWVLRDNAVVQSKMAQAQAQIDHALPALDLLAEDLRLAHEALDSSPPRITLLFGAIAKYFDEHVGVVRRADDSLATFTDFSGQFIALAFAVGNCSVLLSHDETLKTATKLLSSLCNGVAQFESSRSSHRRLRRRLRRNMFL